MFEKIIETTTFYTLPVPNTFCIITKLDLLDSMHSLVKHASPASATYKNEKERKRKKKKTFSWIRTEL